MYGERERERENPIMIEFASERKVFQLPSEVNIGMAACLAPEGEIKKKFCMHCLLQTLDKETRLYCKRVKWMGAMQYPCSIRY